MTFFKVQKWSVAGALALLPLAMVVASPGGASTHSAKAHPASQDESNGQMPWLHQVANVTFPSPFVATTSYDIGFADPNSQTYYLADRTNAGVDAVNTNTDTFGGVIGAGQFVGATPTVTAAQTKACGTSVAGPNGVLSLTVGGVNQVWASDGVTASSPVSTVKVFTLSSGTAGTLAATIPTGVSTFGTSGTCRADEMAYDPRDRLFIVANPADSPPYVSLITVNANPNKDAVVAQIKFPTATGGIEQSVFDPQTDLFYVNIPGVELAVINPNTLALATTYAQPNCTSSGLTLDPRTQQLLVSCSINPLGSMLMDARNGNVTARFPQISGADEIWYDPGTDAYYLGANRMTSDGNTDGYPTPAIGVISGGGRGRGNGASWLENVPTGATTTNTHSVAVDPNNGQVLVPVAGYGITVMEWTPPLGGN